MTRSISIANIDPATLIIRPPQTKLHRCAHVEEVLHTPALRHAHFPGCNRHGDVVRPHRGYPNFDSRLTYVAIHADLN